MGVIRPLHPVNRPTHATAIPARHGELGPSGPSGPSRSQLLIDEKDESEIGKGGGEVKINGSNRTTGTALVANISPELRATNGVSFGLLAPWRVRRLRQLADACEPFRPDLAEMHRTEAQRTENSQSTPVDHPSPYEVDSESEVIDGH